ncbi:MAG: peptidylprolyl isomerase [Anaerolineales bacterium]|nr:peptidylprolyl isomerase [Anaerolineales bacterium]
MLTWFLAACKSTPTPFIPPSGNTLAPGETAPAVTAPEDTSLPPTATPTPSPTPIPLALTVNDEAITQAEYDASFARLLVAQPDLTPEDARTRVLDEFVDQLLLAHAATQAGYIVDDATLEAHIQALGPPESLNTWMSANGYTEDLFRTELRRALAAAWMRDQIVAGVPTTAEQVHVRQILLLTAGEADSVYAQIQGGVAFDLMASYYDPVSLGDLGWFPRGYLTETAIEEAAFTLEIGKYSPVITTNLGYHIIELLDRQPDRPLEPAVLMDLQEKAVVTWLAQQRTASNILVLLP